MTCGEKRLCSALASFAISFANAIGNEMVLRVTDCMLPVF
jgi:hypothetical protein